MFTIKVIPPDLSKIQKWAVGMHGEIQRAVATSIKDAERISKQEFLSGPRPDKLAPVTGTLRRSVRGSFESEGEISRGILSSNTVYSRIHEMGGHIRRGKTGRSYWMRARPYLQPAVKAVVPYLRAAISKIMTKVG